jgi:hypothetical protein
MTILFEGAIYKRTLFNPCERRMQDMKSMVTLLGCVARFIGQQVFPAATIGALVLGIGVAYAQTLPQATSHIETLAGPASDSNKVVFDVEEDKAYDNFQVGTGYTAEGNISVSFGTNAPVAIAGQAFTSVSAGQAYATAGGNLRYYFRVVQVGNPPWQPPSIPTLFEGSGQGQVSKGYGMFDASAFVGGYPGFPSNLFKIHWEGGPHSASFSQPLTLDLLINNQYQVLLAATAFAYSAFNLDKESNAYVYVDPTISFDQATFNARYPQNSFPLSDYYSLEFSSNVNLNPPLTATEHQVTFELDEQTTPTLGRDAIGDYVVFTTYTPVSTGVAQSDIYYQRLVNGQPVGNRVPVAVTALDERLNECSGDYIVYTSFESVTSLAGKTMLYQISTGQTRELDSANDTFLPKIYGDVVVWLKSTANGNLALIYRISWGTPVQPVVLAGPVPNPRDIDVGDRFVVWSQIVNGQYDIAAYDIQNGGIPVSVSSNPNLNERVPSTGGPWVAYQVSSAATPAVIAIHARNLDTGETRIVADNGAANSSPNIDGNLISYESNITGNWDIYVCRIAQGDTFQVTSRPDDQRLNDIHGNLVAYVDARNGNLDVFVSTLTFNINHPPILSPIGNKTVNEGQLLEFVITATDPDGNTLTYTASNLPLGATFDPLTQKFTWLPDYTQAGNYNVLFNVTDNGTPPMSASETITITVGNVNRPPVLYPIGNKQGSEGQLLQFTITATDPDGDALTYSASNLPPGATFDPISRTFSWLPTYDQAGNYPEVRFTATDSGVPSASASEAITITIGNVNRPPVLGSIGNKQVSEGQLLQFTITATDPDGDALIYSASNLPSGASFDPSTRTFIWIPSYDQAGNYPEVRFTVADNGMPPESTSEAITITVGNVNRPPVLGSIGNKQVSEGQLLQFTITATDPDRDALIYSASNLPPGATFDPATQTFSWTPGYDQAGSYPNIEFTVTDNGNPIEIDTELITITVGNVNRAPVFTPVGTQQVFENQLLQFSVMATDYDGDRFSYSTGPLQNGASFDPMSRLFSWRPDSTQAGTYTVVFYATDTGSPPMQGQLDVVINVGEVPTPCQLVDQIIQTVLSLNLRKSVENSYMANLKKVCKFVEDGKVIQAIVQLDVFIAKVVIDVVKHDISEAAGRSLVNMAINLIKIIKS